MYVFGCICVCTWIVCYSDEQFENVVDMVSFTSIIPANKFIPLHAHSTMITFRKLTLIQYDYNI